MNRQMKRTWRRRASRAEHTENKHRICVAPMRHSQVAEIEVGPLVGQPVRVIIAPWRRAK